MSLVCKKKNKKIVFIGLSGGVDSSVSAALLKKDGFEVVGVYIKPWDPADDKEIDWGIVCQWRAERREAIRVAAHLDIPLITFDASKKYKEKVIDYLLGEYQAGRTPNPDVMCNKQIKFGVFYDWAISQGADLVATGHYGQIKVKKNRAKKSKKIVGKKNKIHHLYQLVASRDKNKDQTYFLWNLKQEQLARILFPVGGFKKEEVRRLARKFDLPNADKKDSQGLCFIGQVDFKKFLTKQITPTVGQVLNEAGEVIGQHNGAVFLTVGERHNFQIEKKTPKQKPLFVISKDVGENTVTVSPTPMQSQATTKTFQLDEVNWIGQTPTQGQAYQARFRHRQALQTGQVIISNEGKIIFQFDQPQLKPSGQSLVIYDGEVCLGGGIID